MAIPPGPGSDSVTSVPTCFRHPHRETHVSCVRCGRPACPDCLRSAAVGQQCVECIRQGNRGTRQVSGIFGGRVSGTPVVTYTLIALNVLAYVIELAYGKALDYGEMVGVGVASHQPREIIGVAVGDWYRLLSSAFLHEPPDGGIGLLHIVFNMWALYVVGPALEQMLGRGRFVAVYLVSALAGSVLLYILAPFQPAIGASGAIFGLFGAWFVVARRLRLDARMIVGLIVINLVISFTVPDIAWQDHIGGLVAGAALTAAYVYAPRESRTVIGVAATVGLLLLVVAGVVLKDQSLVHQVVVRF